MKKIYEHELHSLSLSEKLDHVLHALGVVLAWNGNNIDNSCTIAARIAAGSSTSESIKKYRIVPNCPWCEKLIRNDDGKCTCGAVVTPPPAKD